MAGTSAFHPKQTLGEAAYLSVDSSMLITFGPGMSKPLGLIGAMIAHDNAMFVSRDEGRNVRGAVAGAPILTGAQPSYSLMVALRNSSMGPLLLAVSRRAVAGWAGNVHSPT